MNAPLPRRLFAEFLGSAFLAANVVGSGSAAEQRSPSDAISDLDLSYTPPLGSTWEAKQVGAQALALESAR